jgi:hypothetical protein
MISKKMNMKIYYKNLQIISKVSKEQTNNPTKNNNIHYNKIKFKLRITLMTQLTSNFKTAILMKKM